MLKSLRLSVRQRKAIRDLWLNKTRSSLVIIAIAIGIFGVGSILSAYSILTREMDANYLGTNPPSAVLTIDNLDEELVTTVENFSFVSAVEARRSVMGRIQIGENEWKSIRLFIIDDFDNTSVSTFSREEGAIQPATGEILIERAAVSLVEKEVGDIATIRTPNGEQAELRIVGINHDPAQAPAWMEGMAYGYINKETLPLFDLPPTLNELHIVFDPAADFEFVENGDDTDDVDSMVRLLHGNSPENSGDSRLPHQEVSLDEATIRRAAYGLKTYFESEGYLVSKIYVPPPGEHPHNDQMQALLFLLEAFGVLALILSGVLVATMIGALLSQQVRQIGVMKAIGGRTRQIGDIYVMMVMMLGSAALVIGIPLGLVAGRAYAKTAADTLNFEIMDNSVPYWVFLVQILAGLLLPVIVTLFPIWRGSRITVQEAISDYGVNQNTVGNRLIDKLLVRLQGIGRITLLSLRNTFRRQSRLIMTVLTLSFGGAAFMVALNVGESWTKTVEASFDNRNYDLTTHFAESYTPDKVDAVISNISSVEQWEGWGETTASFVYEDGTNSNDFRLFAPPADTSMINFPVREGRWLSPDDSNAIVINHNLHDHESDIHMGQTITVDLDGRQCEFIVIGIIEEVGAPEFAYVNYPYFTTWMANGNSIQHARVRLNQHDDRSQEKASAELEQAFENAGLSVNAAQVTSDTRQVLLDHIVVILVFLLLMAMLVVAVGGLGLASTMSLNVLERTREIGVLRSIGATDMAILKIVMIEGLFIGLLSWGIAVLLSFPLTNLIGNVAGQIFIQADLDMVYAPIGIGGWLLIVVVISAVASAFPALKATELPVHNVLAYE